MTLKISYLKKLKKYIEALSLSFTPIKVTTGNIHPGWSHQSGVQFHKHGARDDYALHLEISRPLRDNDRAINCTVEIIANSLKKVINRKTDIIRQKRKLSV